ncbi:MAG: TlpA family protein disulfide reductase [Steroidobacteraceae bacterium]|jgi:thiol-disulfide isomerase/thioredoxin
MPALDAHFRPPARWYALLLCLAVATPAAIADTPGEVPVGGILRAANMQGLNGPSQDLSAFRGRPLLINVWASWCGPCKAEMASLERLAWRDGDQYFAIIGISTDDDADQARSLLKKTNATISHFIDRGLQMENMLGASKLPLTVLVDADGRVIEKIYGARQWDSADARRLIDRAFHRPSSSITSDRDKPVPHASNSASQHRCAQKPQPMSFAPAVATANRTLSEASMRAMS